MFGKIVKVNGKGPEANRSKSLQQDYPQILILTSAQRDTGNFGTVSNSSRRIFFAYTKKENNQNSCKLEVLVKFARVYKNDSSSIKPKGSRLSFFEPRMY